MFFLRFWVEGSIIPLYKFDSVEISPKFWSKLSWDFFQILSKRSFLHISLLLAHKIFIFQLGTIHSILKMDESLTFSSGDIGPGKLRKKQN